MTYQAAMSPRSSKRRSLNVTMGPRPLHLVDGNIPSSPTLVTQSPLPKPNIRRHSSISYRFSDHIIDPPLLSTSPISTSPVVKEHGQCERQPLTLVEKHSDLLHFIAQKESKCLELRSQLANLEAEIVQLKRKWERIVNRGFNPPASVPAAQGNGAVLEGIVGGVGRFIAAGLAMGEQKPQSPSLSSVPRSFPHLQSSATYVAKSSPLSQSPTSSIAVGSASSRASNDGDGEPAQILMVHDTGATPTMSPNPAFERQRQQQQQEQEQYFEVPKLSNPKLRRRKRDGHSHALVPCEGSSTSFESTLEVTEAAVRAKRASVQATSFPPVSAMPGLAALTVGLESPVSPLVESVGKKWEELQRNST
ncbi:hypothetical protein C0992_005556 [Termitomyces sp. T32_za158]|nr:hypothetical protein C0992_005556 [Termitomyces sp. T32_za158]